MTPKEFQALRGQWEENEQLVFIHHGVVAATIANVNRDSKTKPFTPMDFAPQKRHYMTIEESQAAMECWVENAGGVDQRNKETENNGTG